MIQIEKLRKTYNANDRDAAILKDVSLSIPKGEVVSIVGTSGSGKTTLLNVIGGLDRDYMGSVKVDGQTLKQLSDAQISRFRNKTIGFVFQSFNLLPHLTCGENIAMPAYFAPGWNNAEITERVNRTLERVGIPKKVDQYPDLLSGGERQRVAIARALFNQPSVLLCDEPTGNLDTKTGNLILDLFMELNQKDKITVVLVTHDLAVSQRANRTIHIVDGEITSVNNAPQPQGEK